MSKFSTKSVVLVAIGAALYGVGGLPAFGFTIFANTSLKPAIAILAIFAGVYGPIIGALVGLLGHLLTDIFAGWGVWPAWVLGSGIVGLIMGFFSKITQGRHKDGLFPPKDIIFFIVLAFLANFLGYSISALLDYLFYAEPLEKLITQQLLIAGTNTLVIAVIGSIVMSLLAKKTRQSSHLKED